MREILFLIFLLIVLTCSASARSTAERRASLIADGMNVSYLDNWWLGTKAKNYSDFAKPVETAKREKMFAAIAKAGFKTVRIPICFGAWASLEKPYRWQNEQGLEMADHFVKWAADNGLNAVIDLHHTEFDGKFESAASTDRMVWLWQQIAARYKNTDPEKVFFELRNEPHDIQPEVWRAQAEAIIKAARTIAPEHTLIVGFHDWNSRSALVGSKPFADGNIIYTFHYYDPFVYTHQGATWSSEGLPELRSVQFPASGKVIEVPQTAKGKWVETQIRNYAGDSKAEKMFADLKAAADWARTNNVPIFLGEFGSFNKYPSIDDRCRHAAVVYSALGRLHIPNSWWEWDGGFNMFEKGTTRMAGCMRKAVESFRTSYGQAK